MSSDISNALVISRRNIACFASLLIETLCSLTRKQLDESCSEVIDLLRLLHHIFFHGFKYKRSKLIKWTHPWRSITAYSSQDCSGCVELVKLLEGSQDDSSQLIAWIKALLLKRCLMYGLDFVRRTCSALRINYYPEALLFSEDLDQIIVLARCLDRVDFNLDLKNSHTNSEVLLPINYAAYLHPCNTSADDCRGARETPTHTDHTHPPFLSLRDTYLSLLKDCRTLEEKLALQDSRLKRYEIEVCKLRRLRQDLESQILELQIQVTLYHEECTRKLLEAGLNYSIHRPPTVTLWESIRRRRQRLVVMAESASAKSFADASTIHTHPCNYTMPSLLLVDQGVDALQMNSHAYEGDSFDHLFHRPLHSTHVAPDHPVTLEIGEEPQPIAIGNKADYHVKFSKSASELPLNQPDHSSGPILGRSCTTLYLTPSLLSEGTISANKGLGTCYGLQKMPRDSEYFFLPNISASHSSFHRKPLCDLIEPVLARPSKRSKATSRLPGYGELDESEPIHPHDSTEERAS